MQKRKVTYLVEDIKEAMGITAHDFDQEIKTMIEACFLELDLAGINTPKEYSPSPTEINTLIKQALIFYCKAYMRIDANSPSYMKAFEHLKDAMSLSAEYRRNLSEESGNV